MEGYPPSDGVTDRPEDPPRFHPLGIAYDQKSETLFVINHHPFGSRIDIFSLSLGSPLSSSRAPTATYLRSIKHPQHLISPNAIAIIDRNTLLVTNDHAFPAVKYGRAVSRAEHIIGHPGGSVVLVNLGEDGGNKDPIFTRLDSVTFSNGIAIVPAPRLEDPYKLVVASTSGPSLLVYDLFPAGRWAPGEKGVRLRGKLQNRTTILLPFAPDNLSVDSNGKVLVTGHAHPPTFDTYITTRVRCNAAGPVPADCHDTANNSPSWIAELDLWATGGPRRRDLWVSQDFPSASSAARDTKLGIGAAVGLYARGVLVWWEGSAKDASQELEPNELHATQLV